MPCNDDLTRLVTNNLFCALKFEGVVGRGQPEPETRAGLVAQVVRAHA